MIERDEPRTRERVLRAAEQFFGDCGYHGTRLHRLAETVGIQKASLFHYFPSKSQLYHAVIEQGAAETEEIVRRVIESEGDPYEKLRFLVDSYIDSVAAHRSRTKILLRQSLGDAPPGQQTNASQRLLRMVTGYIMTAQSSGLLPPIDPAALVLGVVGMVAFFFTSGPVLAPSWFGDPTSPESVARVKQYVLEVVDHCLAAAPGSAQAEATGGSDPRRERSAGTGERWRTR